MNIWSSNDELRLIHFFDFCFGKSFSLVCIIQQRSLVRDKYNDNSYVKNSRRVDNYVEWKKRDTRILRREQDRAARRKKWNSIHTHSHVWGKHAAGKIADILRQCYACVISHAGIVTLGSLHAMFVLHARLTVSLSQCCSMPSPMELRLFCNNVDHHAIDRVSTRLSIKVI